MELKFDKKGVHIGAGIAVVIIFTLAIGGIILVYTKSPSESQPPLSHNGWYDENGNWVQPVTHKTESDRWEAEVLDKYREDIWGSDGALHSVDIIVRRDWYVVLDDRIGTYQVSYNQYGEIRTGQTVTVIEWDVHETIPDEGTWFLRNDYQIVP